MDLGIKKNCAGKAQAGFISGQNLQLDGGSYPGLDLVWVMGSDILNIDPTPTELTTVNDPA
jgi:hypothetical protein